MILNLCRITFHPVVVLGPEHDFLFKSASTYCEVKQLRLNLMFVYCAVSTFAKKWPQLCYCSAVGAYRSTEGNHCTVACRSIVLLSMALPVMEFQDQGYKIRKIFA